MRSTLCGFVAAAPVLLTLQVAFGQTTVFRTDFEYSSEPQPADIGTDAANLNFADTQIGTFFGTLPTAQGDINLPGPHLMGFQNNPDQPGRLLVVDRPQQDGSFFAQFTDPVEVNGASFSFDVGSRRTVNGNRSKDYSIIGLDQNNNELFHLTVNTQNNQERLSVTHSGGTNTDSLIADFGGVGADGNQDLDNLSAPAFDANEIGSITLDLTDTGYTLDFTNANGSNAYTTNEIPFNGSPDSLFSQVQFTFAGNTDNAQNSGFVLDNLLAQGTLAAVPEPATLTMWTLLGIIAAGLSYFRLHRTK